MYKLDRGRQWLSITIVVVMAFVLIIFFSGNTPMSAAEAVALLLSVFVFAGAAPAIILRAIFNVEVTRRDASECAFVVSAILGLTVAFGLLFVEPFAILGVPVLIFIAWGSSQLTALLLAKALTNVGAEG